MKTITALLVLITALAISSCEGPMGPPGLPGQDGDSFIGTVFEIQGDFTPGNDYSLFYEFPSNFVIYDTDVVLVYILWEQSNGTDVWRLMPQTVVLKTINANYPETDVIQYNFDYTVFDVQIFLETTMDYNDLLPGETDNQIFRIVVLPADFLAKKSVDINDINTVIRNPELHLNIMNNISAGEITK